MPLSTEPTMLPGVEPLDRCYRYAGRIFLSVNELNDFIAYENCSRAEAVIFDVIVLLAPAAELAASLRRKLLLEHLDRLAEACEQLESNYRNSRSIAHD